MYLADYHTHSRMSPDAATPMADMARAAAAAGMNEICLTDHVEPVEWLPGRPPAAEYDWQALEAEFASARAAVGDAITMRLGVELGDAFWDFAQTERMMAAAPKLDFVIGSVHMLSRDYETWDLSVYAPEDEAAARRAMADYLESVYAMAKWGKFSVLGHLTLPLRYFREKRGLDVSFDPFGGEIEDIFRALIQNGCGIEVNTNRGHTPLPDEKWLRLYRSMGGEIITLGSDAHTPEFAGCVIREGQALLQACGFARFCTFDGGAPVWHEL